MSDSQDFQPKTRGAGQVLFVGATLFLSVLLLSRIGTETGWFEETGFAAQPRFWPAVALTLMVSGFGLHFWRLRRRRPDQSDWRELRRWAAPLEYVLWFMGFVYAVPLIGFLPMSLIFAVALTWRLGYRQRHMLWLAAAFGVLVVVLFKALLGVKIPGAALYELLPGALRSFFVLYL